MAERKIKRLADVFVGEISLVTKGAVPESDLVIAKADVFEAPEAESGEVHRETLEKVLDSAGNWSTSSALNLLAEMSRAIAWLKEDIERIPEEVLPAIRDLFEQITGSGLLGDCCEDDDESDDGDLEKRLQARLEKLEQRVEGPLLRIERFLAKGVAPAGAEDEPATKPEPTEDELVAKAFADALNQSGLTDSLANLSERFESIEAKYDRACGKDA